VVLYLKCAQRVYAWPVHAPYYGIHWDPILKPSNALPSGAGIMYMDDLS
jgi:hypothetical protein